MKFFKKNSYDVVRLYINQVGITIFSLALYFAVGTIDDTALLKKIMIAVSAFAFIFYLCLIYCVIWEIGSKDKIRVEGGKMEADRFKGLKLSVFANVPNFLLSIVACILTVIVIFTGAEWAKLVLAILYLILHFHCAMFFGMIYGVTATAAPEDPAYYNVFLVKCILYLVLPLVSLAVSHLAYYLGSKDKKLFSSSAKNKN